MKFEPRPPRKPYQPPGLPSSLVPSNATREIAEAQRSAAIAGKGLEIGAEFLPRPRRSGSQNTGFPVAESWLTFKPLLTGLRASRTDCVTNRRVTDSPDQSRNRVWCGVPHVLGKFFIFRVKVCAWRFDTDKAIQR